MTEQKERFSDIALAVIAAIEREQFEFFKKKYEENPEQFYEYVRTGNTAIDYCQFLKTKQRGLLLEMVCCLFIIGCLIASLVDSYQKSESLFSIERVSVDDGKNETRFHLNFE